MFLKTKIVALCIRKKPYCTLIKLLLKIVENSKEFCEKIVKKIEKYRKISSLTVLKKKES